MRAHPCFDALRRHARGFLHSERNPSIHVSFRHWHGATSPIPRRKNLRGVGRYWTAGCVLRRHPNGGVWKTTSAGATWFPIFDSIQSVSSIGAVEVAPSYPNVIYIGTGDLNSFFDGAATGCTSPPMPEHVATHGLEGTQQITAILVHPRDPNLVLVGALGASSRPERRAWRVPVLGRRGDLGQDPLHRRQDWHRALARAETRLTSSSPRRCSVNAPRGPASHPSRTRPQTRTRLYKSTDGGLTVARESPAGAPRLAGRISLAVCNRQQRPARLCHGDFGLYRSMMAARRGATWPQDDDESPNGPGRLQLRCVSSTRRIPMWSTRSM